MRFVRIYAYFFAVFLLIATPPLPLHAKEPASFTGPLLTRSQNPILLQFLSLIPSSAETLPSHHYAASVQTVFSNLFERELKTAGAGVDMDMELWRTSFFLQYGLGQGFELDVEIPFLHTSGGFLDSFIQSYHDTFGFPNAGRDNVDNGRFSYAVTLDNTSIYQVGEAFIVPSDWTLSLKKPLYEHPSFGDGFILTAQHLIKLPIGRRASGGGSGNVDYGVSFIGEQSWKQFRFTTQIGVIFFGGHDNLDPILRSQALQWIESIEWSISRPLSLIVQLQGMTSPFNDTNNKALGSLPLDLIIGFAGNVFDATPHRFFWQVAFAEDPTGKGPAIDFSTYFRIGRKF